MLLLYVQHRQSLYHKAHECEAQRDSQFLSKAPSSFPLSDSVLIQMSAPWSRDLLLLAGCESSLGSLLILQSALRCDSVLCKWRLLIGWFSLWALLWRKLLSKKLTLSAWLAWTEKPNTNTQSWKPVFLHTSLQLSAPGTRVQGELYQIKAALIS